jgi:uncharacterized protein YbjT (DUF2867 family)
MQAQQTIAVAGATGRVGRHVADILEAGGQRVIRMSRASGVDVVTGDGLAEALAGAECIIDAATGPSAEQAPATQFFSTAARNLQAMGSQAGVQRIVVVSIIGCDHFTAGYGAAKIAHEQAILAGPIPARVLRAAQFHEFVAQLVEWGRRGDVSYVPSMRTQLVAARTVAEALVDLATSPQFEFASDAIPEIAGPREESLVEMAELLVARRGEPVRIEGVVDPSDPDHGVYQSGALLPGPYATLAGPTFEEWLAATRLGTTMAQASSTSSRISSRSMASRRTRTQFQRSSDAIGSRNLSGSDETSIGRSSRG